MAKPRINPPILCQRHGYDGTAIRITACPPRPGSPPSEIKLQIVDASNEYPEGVIYLDPLSTAALIKQLLSPGFPD